MGVGGSKLSSLMLQLCKLQPQVNGRVLVILQHQLDCIVESLVRSIFIEQVCTPTCSHEHAVQMLYRCVYQKALSKLVVLILYHLGHLTLTTNELCIHFKNISTTAVTSSGNLAASVTLYSRMNIRVLLILPTLKCCIVALF